MFQSVINIGKLILLVVVNFDNEHTYIHTHLRTASTIFWPKNEIMVEIEILSQYLPIQPRNVPEKFYHRTAILSYFFFYF